VAFYVGSVNVIMQAVGFSLLPDDKALVSAG